MSVSTNPSALPAPQTTSSNGAIISTSGWIAPLNAIAATLHAVQAVIVLALAVWLDHRDADKKQGIFTDGRIPVYRIETRFTPPSLVGVNATTNNNFTVTSVAQPYGALDIRALICSFFAVSALFQGAATCLFGGRSGRLRYVEYSISASIMVLAISSEAGIRDAYTLACQFILTWITMWLGLIADNFQESYSVPDVSFFEAWLWLGPHIAGWVTCLTAYSPIIDVFLLNSSPTPPDVGPPSFVRVIVFMQFGMFTAFGFVQLVHLVQRSLIAQQASYAPLHYWNGLARGYTTNAAEFSQKANLLAQFSSIDDMAELAYIALSLSAKTMLGWIVLSPLLMRA